MVKIEGCKAKEVPFSSLPVGAAYITKVSPSKLQMKVLSPDGSYCCLYLETGKLTTAKNLECLVEEVDINIKVLRR